MRRGAGGGKTVARHNQHAWFSPDGISQRLFPLNAPLPRRICAPGERLGAFVAADNT